MRRHTAPILRVLVVLAQPPLLEGGAASRSAVGLLRGLLGHGLEVQALVADRNPAARRMPPSDLPVEIMPMPLTGGMKTRWRRLADPRGQLGRPPFSDRLRALAADADIVHLEELDSAAAGAGLTPPSVLHLHNSWRRDGPGARLWTPAGREYLEHRWAERRAAPRARWLVANSREIASELAQAAPGASVSVAPLTLDPEPYRDAATLEAPVAGLIGRAPWPPTANAVRRLVERVWPRVRERAPDARLRLAGFGMEAAAFGYETPTPGIEWVGPVPSATEFLRSLGVLFYPVDRGSGTKIKVLESLALGLPVVTTADGAEGLVTHDGVIVESGDAALAQATAALLNDAGSRRTLGAAGRAAFTAHHTPVPGTAPLVELYRSILS